MAKKAFDTINTAKADTGAESGAVYEAIARGESTRQQQGTASPEEQAERAENLKTQGRKGCKAVRINTAYSPSNYDFVKTMGAATGEGMTKFLNRIIDEYRNAHGDLYEQAKAVLSQVQAITGAEAADKSQ